MCRGEVSEERNEPRSQAGSLTWAELATGNPVGYPHPRAHHPPPGPCHLPRPALPPPGLLPTAPDSGVLRACPTAFRGSLCKQGALPHLPPRALCTPVPWGAGGAGDREPSQIPTAHAATHGAALLTPAHARWDRGMYLSTPGTPGVTPFS